jgi:Ser/Thr protein kinase RdoA (MazF antagonist)
MAGAINAALFLEDFVPPDSRTGCTSTCSPGTTAARPGRPVGGEAQTLRTLLACAALFQGLRPVHLHRAGVLIAQLHDSAQALQAQGLFPPAHAAHGAELSRLADHSDRLRRWGGRRLQHAVDAATQRLALQQRHWPRDGRHHGWIHGDLHPWNLLFADGRAGAIDFSDSGWGWLAQDLAAVLQFLRHPLAGLADHRPQQPRLRDALLAGYASVRPWPGSLGEQVDALHAQRLLNTVLWMADDWSSPADRPWGPAFLAQLPAALKP